MSSNSLHYRQNIVASIRIAGHQIGDVVSHGGNRAAGSHITACFGSQVMITMLDLDGALQFAGAWLSPNHRWVYAYLPAEIADAGTKDAVSTGPSLTVRANGVGKIDARYDSIFRTAHIRAGAVTWIVQDRAAADSMITTWRYIARIGPVAAWPAAGRLSTRSRPAEIIQTFARRVDVDDRSAGRSKRDVSPGASPTPGERPPPMYVITSNITGNDPTGDSATGTAETIPAALVVFAGQLRRALLVGGVRWSIVDPTGTEHPGHITLGGRLDLLHSAVNELCDELYVELHRMADGYRGV